MDAVQTPLTVPHIALDVVWATLAAVHVARRRRIYGAVLRRGLRWRAVATSVLISTALVVTVSGLAQCGGMAAAIPWHAGSSMLLVLLAGSHAARKTMEPPPARSCHNLPHAAEGLVAH